MQNNLPSTQRAYPLRLNGNEPCWRHRLWHTHLAVNRLYGGYIETDQVNPLNEQPSKRRLRSDAGH